MIKEPLKHLIEKLTNRVDALNAKTSTYYAPNEIPSGTDLNNFKTVGRYALRNSNILNAPTATQLYGFLDVVSYTGDFIAQIICAISGTNVYIFLRRFTNNTWGNWITFGTGYTRLIATPIDNMYTGDIIAYRKNGVVTLKLNGITISEAITTRTTIASLPVGYMPLAEVACRSDTNSRLFLIGPSGTIKAEPQESGKLWASVTYVCDG